MINQQPKTNNEKNAINSLVNKNYIKYNDIINYNLLIYDNNNSKVMKGIKFKYNKNNQLIKNKSLKLRKHSINSLYIYFIILYLIIFLSKEKKLQKINYASEITIEIKGKGNQLILSNYSSVCGSSFKHLPDKILVNGILQNDEIDKYAYDLINEVNNITLIWNDELTDCNSMFSDLSNIIRVDLSKFNSSKVKEMKCMFSDCVSLTSINFNNLDTSKVTIMKNMFDSCISLTSLNLNNLDTSSVEIFTRMFYNCSSLITIDLNNFSMSSANTIEDMFMECNSLISLDLRSFNTSTVTIMTNMFSGCSSLTSIDLSSFDTSSVANMNNLFYGCKSIIALNLDNFNTSNLLVYDGMFSGCNNNLIYCINETKASIISSLLDSYLNNCTYFCTNKKMINGTEKCVENCNDDDLYKYEYNNICYKHCPSGTIISPNNKYICEKLIQDLTENYFNNIFNNKNNIMEADDIILNIRNGILNGYFDLSDIIEGKNDLLYIDNNIIYQITSTDNQKYNKYNNISIINLCECENKLKSYYNIKEDEPLLIFKIDIHEDGLLYPIVEYEIYNSKGKIQLNLEICNDTKINITFPVSIDENYLFKHNLSSEYYNDICYAYTTEKGTDIILNDRKKEFINNNLSLCEFNCDLGGYNSETKNAECECNVKKEISLDSDNSFNKTEFLMKFIDIDNIFNIQVIKCYKLLFSNEGLNNNIGNCFQLSITFTNIISCILFILKGYNLLLDEINKLFESNLNNNIVNNELNKERERERDIKIKKITKKSKKTKINKEPLNKVSFNDGYNSKITINNYKIKQNKNENNEKMKIKENNPPKYTLNNAKKNKDKTMVNLGTPKTISRLELIQPKNNNILKIGNKSINYNDYELNNLGYEEALTNDKRTYLQYYLSLLKRKHIIIFTFYTHNDYNSRIIKICLFLFFLGLYLTVNALFFNDSTMHKIYEDQGDYNFIYQIPQIIYSTIISSILNYIIKILSLTEKNILAIKREKEDIKNKYKNTLKCLKIKFFFFFILLFIFLVLFWYYVSCFCAVYKNTQNHLIKDTIISFSLSLVYPFGISLLPVYFRISSLKVIKKNGKCLYILSKIIQIF